MKEPIISNLEHVTKKMINALEVWLENVKSGEWEGKNKCPFGESNGDGSCSMLFENLSTIHCKRCPCHTYGSQETILAFTIICDVWKAYRAKP